MRNNLLFPSSWPAFLLLFLCCFPCPPAKAEVRELFESTNLWNAGIGGYQTYRIPGIVVSKRGVIIAYTSARRTLDLGDWSNIDIVLRRSSDGGRTWEPSRRIAGDSHGTTDNPVAIVDRQTGALHFLFQKNYARCYYMQSQDDGRTFSSPVDITYVLRPIPPGVRLARNGAWSGTRHSTEEWSSAGTGVDGYRSPGGADSTCPSPFRHSYDLQRRPRKDMETGRHHRQ